MWHSKEDSIKLIALALAAMAACSLYLTLEPMLVSWFIPLDDREVVKEAERHLE